MTESKDLMNPAEVGMCEHGNFKNVCAQCESAERGEEQVKEIQEQTPEELTPEEKNKLAFKKTVNEFKEILNPKSAINDLKNFFKR